jgi:putative sigma-54 modulation protein
MTTDSTPVELQVTFRGMESADRVKKYINDKLVRTVRALPNLRRASAEVSFEGTRSAEQRYVVQVTLSANGTILRAESRGPDPRLAVDQVNDVLDRRIRDWKDQVYFRKRKQGAAYKEAVEMERARLLPEDESGLIVRMKSHETKPMFPEDAVEQMELLGHDFYFFLNAETNQHNVVYRRRAGGYGIIEPSIGPIPGSVVGDASGR